MVCLKYRYYIIIITERFIFAYTANKINALINLSSIYNDLRKYLLTMFSTLCEVYVFEYKTKNQVIKLNLINHKLSRLKGVSDIIK